MSQDISALEETLLRSPEDPHVLEKLSAAYFEQEQFDKSYEYTQKALNCLPPLNLKITLLERLGVLDLQYRNNPSDAAKVFREVLLISPHQILTLQRLENACFLAQDWKGQLSALRLQLDLTPDKHEKITVLLEMADLWSNRLLSPTNRIEALRAILRIDPGHIRALLLLAQDMKDVLAWYDLARTLLAVTEKSDNSANVIQTVLLLAQALFETLQREDLAISLVEETLLRFPHELPLLDFLISVYETRREFFAMVELIYSRASLETIPDEKVSTLLSAAHIWKERLGNSWMAQFMLEEARRFAPDDIGTNDSFVSRSEPC